MYGVKLAGGGVVLGAVMAFGAARGLQSIVADVPEMDAVALSIAAGSLVVVADQSHMGRYFRRYLATTPKAVMESP